MSMAGVNGEPARSAADKLLSVIEALVEHERLNDIAATAALPKSTVHRILSELVERDFARTDGGGAYLPGPRMLALGANVLGSYDHARGAQSVLRELQQRTGHTIHYAIRSGDEAVYVDKVEAGRRPYQMASRIGGRLVLHCTSIGKAILAHLPPDDVRAIVEASGMERHTPRTIVTLSALLEDLERIRARGFSLDDEENEEDVRCVGAPVFGHLDRVIGGISVSALAFEFDREAAERIGPLVVEAAARVSEGLGARAPAARAVSSP
ncbi:MAG: IclR family transcriptional regulator [Conexibacter sp.]|jgi:DNA-binding IclR family transcriptional regulator|nr:IclR family transcriptional regulator [Conexibacter sp.]